MCQYLQGRETKDQKRLDHKATSRIIQQMVEIPVPEEEQISQIYKRKEVRFMKFILRKLFPYVI